MNGGDIVHICNPCLSWHLAHFFLLTLQSHPALVAGTGAWTLPFNAAMSKHLYTSDPPLSRKIFQTWTCSPAQVLIRALILSSSTQRKQFRMIMVRDTLKRSASPSYWLVPSVPVRRCRPKFLPLHKKGQLRPPKIIVCWLSMVVSIDCLQTWSGTCWRTGLLLNIKYQTLNLVSAPQGTPTNPSLFKNEGIHCFPGPLCCLRQWTKGEALETLAKE